MIKANGDVEAIIHYGPPNRMRLRITYPWTLLTAENCMIVRLIPNERACNRVSNAAHEAGKRLGKRFTCRTTNQGIVIRIAHD